ncbi:hypothetical protein SSX86_025700 [Deinandra increscens subsp. villosa]|uniref:FAS1 domain-containing protein n=1 Tax=Deinandra increscens subsp. villosa TaxID=3103831 RepID=A0AAP0CEQ1_9ASTR
MHLKVYLLIYTNLFFIHYSTAFNITCTLNKYPSLSIFNHYLSETNLATEINSHKKITLFAVPNNAISRLSGKPQDLLKNILKVHVVPDYYDPEKLRNLANQNGQMTTLFQTTGLATGQQGLLKVTVFKKNIFIGSASQSGSGLGAILVRSFSCEPCNLSVIYISTAIVPVGISDPKTSSPVQPPVYVPVNSPSSVQPPVYVPVGSPPSGPITLGPVYAKPSPPSLDPSINTPPSESPADAPEYSGGSPPPEYSGGSPPEPVNTLPPRPPPKVAGRPPGPPPAKSACRNTSKFGSGGYVLTILLSFVYLTVQT